MSTIIIDIETVSTSVAEEPISHASLSPFAGQIISLAMYDLERELGAVYYVGNQNQDFVDDSFKYKVRTEAEILEDFWTGATDYDVFVTFNGRSFTLPFLYHRSAINEIKPTIQLSRNRYLSRQSFPYHVDLMDEFSFYGAMKPAPSLKALTEAYGIDYRQEISGSEVGEFFQQKKFTDLAKRSAVDVLALKSLFAIWQKNFSPPSFINATEL